jgi:hypothetical protein
MRTNGFAIAILCATGFLIEGVHGVQLRDSLVIRGQSSISEHPSGTVLGGIPWKPEYAELRVILENNTADDYRHLEVAITPKDGATEPLQIAAAGQITNLPGCRFLNALGGDANALPPGAGPLIQKSGGFYAGSWLGHVRIQCEVLPAASRLEAILAVAKFVIYPDGKQKQNPAFGKTRTPAAQFLAVGTYETAGGRRHAVNRAVIIEGSTQ